MRIKFGKTALPVEVFKHFRVESIEVTLPELGRRVRLRLDESDPEVFSQIWIRHEYEQELPRQCDVIIDAGANIGLSVLWFKAQYPCARIIAIEPDPSNCERLRQNCEGLDNIIIIQGALWSHDTHLKLTHTDPAGNVLKSWAVKTEEVAGGAAEENSLTRAYSVGSIRKLFQLEKISILKMDIEGAEKEVFEAEDLEWVEITKCFAIETHERIKPGSRTAVLRVLDEARFTRRRKGENLFFHAR